MNPKYDPACKVIEDPKKEMKRKSPSLLLDHEKLFNNREE